MSKTAQKWLNGGIFLAFVFIFAAILFPVFQKVHDAPHHNCQSNLKNLGTAIEQYTQDNDEALPNVASRNGLTTWRSAIYPYTHKSRRLYQCPFRGDEDVLKTGSDGFSQDYAANYTGNYEKTQPDKGKGAFAGAGSKPLFLNDFPYPEKTIALTEAENNDRPEFNIDNAGLFGPSQEKLWAGHKGGSDHEDPGSNYLFVDGHVRWMRPGDTYLTGSSGKVFHNFWYRDELQPLSANGVAVLKETPIRFQ